MRTFKTFKTEETVTVHNYPHNYPYGSLPCQATFGLEFHPKKGFRTTCQTVNPKTGRIDEIKRSNYMGFIRMVQDEATGHVKYECYAYDELAEMKDVLNAIDDNFKTFTKEEIKTLYYFLVMYLKAELNGAITYGGAKFEDVKPLFKDALTIAMTGFKTLENRFLDINIDMEALKNT